MSTKPPKPVVEWSPVDLGATSACDMFLHVFSHAEAQDKNFQPVEVLHIAECSLCDLNRSNTFHCLREHA